jgi:hypothetical protein
VLYLSGAAMYRAEVATAELVALTLTPSHLITGAPPRRRRVRRRRPEQQSACPADADLTPAEAAHISAICSRHHIGPQG